MDELPAVNVCDGYADSEVRAWGTPCCGYRSSSGMMSGRGSALRSCGECGKGFHILADGLFAAEAWNPVPVLRNHPHRGTPAHGRPDEKPKGGGEFFRPRGIGLDQTPGCFICGGENTMHNNIAAFVQCKEAGERVVAFFAQGARLDYRDSEPDRVQVKVGACDAHQRDLARLCEITSSVGVISEAIVAAAVAQDA